MLFLSQLLLTILRRFWKPLLLVLVIGVILGVTYKKGVNACEQRHLLETQKELLKRSEAARRESERVGEQKDRINQDRIKHPKDDARDTCLLSNDPYTVECI